ncbi:alkaline phosphatase-like [Babylonia areolata]|uniref:alkaline phosphatase-like n=1 Tax=Babylonia areolata TaxID=304850 RepID=UPI003FD34674
MRIIVSLVLCGCLAFAYGFGEEDEGKAYWFRQAQHSLQAALSLTPNTQVAHNVILFLGDGMGVSTITAARIYKGQKDGRPGEETQLNFDKFPHAAMSKTYAVNKQTSGSASTATAILSGVKTNYAVLGVDSRVARGSCSDMQNADYHTDSMLHWSHAAGKSTGVITNVRITHATPAAAYAHSPDRFWETDKDMPPTCPGVKDIAYQLLKNNSIQVILGGGRKVFYNRKDGHNLTEEWLSDLRQRGVAAKYVRSASEFRAVSASDTDYLLGLFSESHMSYEVSRNNNEQPSIAEMTRKAIEILSKNKKGFFLFVEGGNIDKAHHQNYAKAALEETVALDDAVRVAKEMTGDDTLIVVTADHSHVFNIAGYAGRGNNILGLVDEINPGQDPTDGQPYTTLVYGNGPGPDRTQNLSTVNTSSDYNQFQRAVPFGWAGETHGGEDVGIYATGPMAHLFHGVHEQSYIAHVMAYAACVGPNTAHCDLGPPTTGDGCSGGEGVMGGVGGRRWGMVVVVVVGVLVSGVSAMWVSGG